MADLRVLQEARDLRDLGWARFPETEHRIPYGRFRNVYLYITEECQLRCGHCYMGERLERARVMPLSVIGENLKTWRQLGGSKLTILGGEATLHPRFEEAVHTAYQIGYEKVILTTNGLKSARTKLAHIPPEALNYVQVSLDGGSPASHDTVRGPNTFKYALETTKLLAQSGHDVRIICTVNRKNIGDCEQLIDIAKDCGVTLVKYHVFSAIGTGQSNTDWALTPPEWLEFTERLKNYSSQQPQIWFQPTYSHRDKIDEYKNQGYRGCVGRNLDRISIFPDGRCYVCSYLFDTDHHFATIRNGRIELNKERNEYDHFLATLGDGCGGCPAEEITEGQAVNDAYPDILPVCRLWKSDV